jgi:hypothetical protein
MSMNLSETVCRYIFKVLNYQFEPTMKMQLEWVDSEQVNPLVLV